jgi:hypothetical protein
MGSIVITTVTRDTTVQSTSSISLVTSTTIKKGNESIIDSLGD